MFHAPMCSVVLTGAGRIFKSLIVFWPMLGACTITLAGILD